MSRFSWKLKPENPFSSNLHTTQTQCAWRFCTEEDGLSVCSIITQKNSTATENKHKEATANGASREAKCTCSELTTRPADSIQYHSSTMVAEAAEFVAFWPDDFAGVDGCRYALNDVRPAAGLRLTLLTGGEVN